MELADVPAVSCDKSTTAIRHRSHKPFFPPVPSGIPANMPGHSMAISESENPLIL